MRALIIALLAVSLFSCKTNEQLLTANTTDQYLLTDEELSNSRFSTSGEYVLVDGVYRVGTFTAMEWELYQGVLVQEVSVTLDDLSVDIEALIKYLHTIMPRAKIEVNTDKFK
jgi:hypothetical protein